MTTTSPHKLALIQARAYLKASAERTQDVANALAPPMDAVWKMKADAYRDAEQYIAAQLAGLSDD